jgi:MtrB/PioB family decaheme-associated outer membrane protein
MKTDNKYFALSKLTLIVQGALIAMIATPLVTYAADDEAAALTQPSNTAEVGVKVMPKDSAKFGEYNGIDHSGAYLMGNFNFRGGDAYKAYDGGSGVNRWEAYGIDLGTTSRELGGSVSNQGQWNIGIKYDELRHNISDTYQTPLQGDMGGNNFTMPAAFGVINTGYVESAASNKGTGAQALTQTQTDLFHKVKVYTDRKNSSFTAGYTFDEQWGIKFDYNHLNQTGAKLMSASTDAAAAASGPLSSTWGVEKILMLMNPTDYTTDTFNLALNWKGDKSFLTVGYYGSLFRDNNNALTFPNIYAAGTTLGTTGNQGKTGTAFPINTLSTMPSNDFHQINLTGGSTLTSSTKLAGGFSYGRNTQDESYPFAMLKAATDTGATGSVAVLTGGSPPQASLNGLVETYHADMKVTNQTNKDLTLSAGFKFNERDNQTASNTYNFIDLGGKNRTAVNTPMSNRKTQVEIAGDYRIDPSNRLHLGYEYEQVERWCNNALANNTRGVAPTGYVYTANSCVQIPKSDENKVVAGYKLTVNEALNFNAGYSYAKRNSDINSSFYNPMQSINEGFENPGYIAFFDASRTEQLFKAGVNWQATEKLNFGLNGRYLDDQFNDSTLGVQQGNTWSTNLDATYSYSENGTASAYMSLQRRQRDLLSESGRLPTPGVLAATSTVGGGLWTNQLNDDDVTVGFSALQKGLMSGKLELAGALTYSINKSGYSTQVPYYIATAAAPTCSSSASLTCGDTPDIKNKILSINITGKYQIDKSNKVTLGYLFQKLDSNDYLYNAYQTGYVGTGNLPTNEQLPSYAVSIVTATYTYTFK